MTAQQQVDYVNRELAERKLSYVAEAYVCDTGQPTIRMHGLEFPMPSLSDLLHLIGPEPDIDPELYQCLEENCRRNGVEFDRNKLEFY